MFGGCARNTGIRGIGRRFVEEVPGIRELSKVKLRKVSLSDMRAIMGLEAQPAAAEDIGLDDVSYIL